MKFFNSGFSWTRPLVFLFLAVWLASSLAACSDSSASPTTVGQSQSTSASGTQVASNTINEQPTNAKVAALATPTPTGRDNRQILTVWTDGWQGNSKVESFFNTILDNYHTLHPDFTVDWQDYGSDTYTKLADALAKGNAPDLVLLDPVDLYTFAARNELSDLNSLASSLNVPDLESNYVQAAWQGLGWANHSYGIPWVATSRVTLINKTLWQQAGLNPTDLPKTFDDLNKDLPSLREKTPKDVTAVWLHPDPLADIMMEGVKLYETGGDGVSRVAAFNNEAVQGRWGYYAELRKDLYFAESGLTGATSDALQLYGGSKVVMVMDGSQILDSLKSQSPEVYKNTLVTAYPMSKGQVLPLQLQGWAIPQKAAQKKLALDFVQLLTSKDNELAFAKLFTTYVPTLKAALDDPFVTSQDEPLAQARAIIAENLGSMRPPEQQLPEPILPSQRDKLVAALVEAQRVAWLREQTPAAALAQAAKTWNDLLK